MGYVLEFTIQELPRMYNVKSRGSTHWRHTHKEKNKWLALVYQAIGGKGPAKPLEKYQLTLTRRSSSECDYDGLVIGFKRVVDALRNYGVIRDDRISNSGPWICTWERCKPHQGHIYVKVEDRADAID